MTQPPEDPANAGESDELPKFSSEIRSLAYAMESMTFHERCQAIYDLAEEQHKIGMKNGRFGYIPKPATSIKKMIVSRDSPEIIVDEESPVQSDASLHRVDIESSGDDWLDKVLTKFEDALGVAQNRMLCGRPGWQEYIEDAYAEAQAAIQAHVDAVYERGRQESDNNYDTRVRENVQFVAISKLPGTWEDPSTNKKLYNQAAVDEAVREGLDNVLSMLPDQRPAATSVYAPHYRDGRKHDCDYTLQAQLNNEINKGYNQAVDEIRAMIEQLTTQPKPSKEDSHDKAE